MSHEQYVHYTVFVKAAGHPWCYGQQLDCWKASERYILTYHPKKGPRLTVLGNRGVLVREAFGFEALLDWETAAGRKFHEEMDLELLLPS
jgi:hypothetical protein